MCQRLELVPQKLYKYISTPLGNLWASASILEMLLAILNCPAPVCVSRIKTSTNIHTFASKSMLANVPFVQSFGKSLWKVDAQKVHPVVDTCRAFVKGQVNYL